MNSGLYRKIVGIAVAISTLALTSCLGLTAPPAVPPSSMEGSSEPRAPSPTGLVAAGRKLFLENCAHCHGADARGDDGPDLHDTPVTDEEIADRITRGVPHQMPSFAKKLHDPEIAALTVYIRSLE